MSDYGVLPTGFARKPLDRILYEIETGMITEFGPGVIQTPQSPFGQLNGLMSDLIAEVWEIALDVYQSHDPDQAEGVTLSTLGKLRNVRRTVDETDIMYRQAITNNDLARIDVQDVLRALRNIPGVTYAQVFFNEGYEDAPDIPPNSVCAAVLGGDDADIAAVLREYVVPGVSTFGNTPVNTIEDGRCRTMYVLRPILVPVTMNLEVKVRRDSNGCPPPALEAIKEMTVAALNSSLVNGDDIDHYRVRSAVESIFPTVELVTLTLSRDGLPVRDAVEMGFIELAIVSTETTTVAAV